jgi:Ca2+-binding EF-hand superfamily protein
VPQPISLTHEEIDKEIFELFDADGSGAIEVNDLEGIGKVMGWKPE